ncbi:MAG: hypothetical protein H0W67_06765 [Gemmatimonadales bacterium]|nr:hypothetical protein [Gemmatimonadales bacterium]
MTGLRPDFSQEPAPAVPLHETLALAALPGGPAGQRHLVVVTTSEIAQDEDAPPGAVLAARFWHPRDRLWQKSFFESLEQAVHHFVQESGWVSLQEQSLDARLAHELIFQARETDFGRPHTAEQVLQEAGMTLEEVADLLDKVEHPSPGAGL